MPSIQMRPILTAVLVAGAALTGLSGARAQSAYDYPWCAIYGDKSGAQACYYASYDQCMATMRGIGGSCIESPYYRGPQPYQGPRHPVRHHRRYHHD